MRWQNDDAKGFQKLLFSITFHNCINKNIMKIFKCDRVPGLFDGETIVSSTNSIRTTGYPLAKGWS